jgi:hypothetical protein|tara:strand:- start:99 stop:323 length:225 start_codon:yes stop_codon:yes gene_type:complete
MKFTLLMLICSYVAGECMTPYPMPTQHTNMYSCLEAGYKESLKKLQEIGPQDVNEHEIYLRFICKQYETPKLPA